MNQNEALESVTSYTIADSWGDIYALLGRATLFFGPQLIPRGKTQAKTATEMLVLMDRYPKIRKILHNVAG